MPPFQFTPLREGRLCTAAIASARANFNSRPSARGDRRCTSSRTQYSNFNSRPSARGDAGCAFFLCLRHPYFNSRPSARGDCRFACCFLAFCISIHAPPRGATQYLGPRNLEELFQFTPLREGRRRKRRHLPLALDFNSRPSARGDSPEKYVILRDEEFQFTPLREGRRVRQILR